MKTRVYNTMQDSSVPFLKGILISSLSEAGLTFEQASQIAADVRSRIADLPKISSDDLRKMVQQRLEKHGFDEALEAYESPAVAPARINVVCQQGQESPFSRGRHQRGLLSSGLSADVSEDTTDFIYEQLLASGVQTINSCQLGAATWLCLRQEYGKKAAARFLAWSEFKRSGRPLLLMIGGSVGSGKSTLATEVAHRLGIVRVQSTDILREVMRMMIPERLLPVLYRSSYDAWKALPARDAADRDADQLVAEGYRTQADLLEVPCLAVLQRALTEGVSVILEGVHVQPGLAAELPETSDAVVINILLAVLKSRDLKSRLRGRGSHAPLRQPEPYLDSFDSIWSLQSHLLSEADGSDVSIISNDEKEETQLQVIRTINHELRKQFDAPANDVFDQAGPFAETDNWRNWVGGLVR